MHVSIERSGCISCGLCASTCPEVHQQPDGGLEDGAREAAENCPVSVIYVD